MDVTEPRARHRGLFLTTHDPDADSPDNHDHEASEGVTIRVRIIRRKIRVRSSSDPSQLRNHSRPSLKSATATDTRRRLRTRH